ncbi:C-C motif chemokine 27a [Hypomesus transpacificus]|uniref:C-C motif chemokine 27a n=1 Tax=Hypomesus transpacificus TaxID=137520 RepID=UPI001F0767A4|nr:C-C motif chemokine 27a [Hypomesus transpacificus]
MELKRVLLGLSLCALLIPTQAAIPKCCVTVSKNISNKMLKRVKHTAQQDDGICQIKALILYLDGKKVCAPLSVWKRLVDVRKKRKPRKQKKRRN